MSNEPMKIPVNYAEASETLRKVLGLKGSPVAIKFATSKEEIPAGMEELDKTIRHCSMVNLARNEGKIFYATAGKHECNGGAWALGPREITPTLKTGDFYFRLGKYDSAAACKRPSTGSPISVPGIPMQRCMPRSKRHRSHPLSS
jgi:uncharacterized protein (DUF169 family)